MDAGTRTLTERAKLIAVEHESRVLMGTAKWKRELLFADRMILMRADSACEALTRPEHLQDATLQNLRRELEYLLSTPYFTAFNYFHIYPVGRPTDADQEYDEDLVAWYRLHRDVQDTARRLDEGDPEVVARHGRLSTMERSIALRLEIQFQRAHGTEAIASDVLPTAGELSMTELTRGDILQLAIRRVPVPDEMTPWEDIFALKADKGFDERARKLRLWASSILQPGMSLRLADEHLGDALSEYEAYMRAHKIKFQSGVLQTALVSGAEILEELAKFKLGKLAGRFFGARAAKAEMLMSEMNAPGRGISMITALNEKLKPRR